MPQQKNDFDCGLFMLDSIETIANAELPPTESVQQLLDHFSAANLSVQDAITELRITLHADLCTKADIDVKEELE